MPPNSQQPWSTYALHIATFTSLSVAFDPLIICLTHLATVEWSGNYHLYALVAQILWMLVTKYVKLHALFAQNPADLIYLPVSILFGYFHGFIKLWALGTLRVVSYLSRLGNVKTNPLRRHLGVAAQTVIPMTTTACLPELAEAKALPFHLETILV